jgi:hypothetical protein
MTIINLLINEPLLKSELELNEATAENIDQLCRNYLKLLGEYRDQLHGLKGIPEIDLTQTSPLARELVGQARRAVRAAIETTVREHNRTDALLASFTSITAVQAAETFNALGYKGTKGWKASSAGVRRNASQAGQKSAEPRSKAAGKSVEAAATPIGSDRDRLTVAEAVAAAGKLRRQAYVNHRVTFLPKDD